MSIWFYHQLSTQIARIAANTACHSNLADYLVDREISTQQTSHVIPTIQQPCKGFPVTDTPTTRVDEGDKAPDFTLPTDGEGSVTLSALAGKPIVVYFYPKDDTSGCTKQAIGFTEAKDAFEALGATIIGISPDSVKKHDKFKTKHDLTIMLAADEEKDVAQAYGVWVEKSMYGKKYMGVERSTFLVASDGSIAKAWRKVKVPGHVDAVLEAVKAL